MRQNAANDFGFGVIAFEQRFAFRCFLCSNISLLVSDGHQSKTADANKMLFRQPITYTDMNKKREKKKPSGKP